MKKIFFFIAALMLTFTAHATIVECNPGTNNLDWYLTQGDTLVLADGIYEEAYSITFNRPGVCVKAAEGAKPVITLTGEWTVLDVQATTTFDGLTFDGGNVAKYLVATTGVNPGTLTINNCEFCNWTYWALSNQFEETASIDSVIVNNTLFHDGAQSAISFGNKAPEGTHACNYFKMTNSTIYNVVSTEYAGIVHVSSNGEATGMQNTIIIDHVTMYNLDGADLGIIAARKTSDLTISNTIIANPAEGERASYVYGGVAENVIYYNVSQDGDLTYTNCLTDDPMFDDAANGNFALADGSPALGAGTDGSNLGDPRWNVVAEPEPVVYNVTVTAENGTVEGAGEFEEGAEVTLTATPAEGYQFVNWTKDEEVVSTENPYTFTVTADIALVANFELIPVVEPEKPEPTYTENNLNPYAFGLESVLSDDKATLTVTYRLNNTKATDVDVVIYNGEEVVKVVAGTKEMGKNTVEIPTEGLPGGVELKWAVAVNGTSVEVPTQETKMYNLYCPHGLAIDTDPESEHFGRILVAEAMQGVPASGYVTSGKGAGLYVFNPSFTTDSVAYKGGNDFTRILASNGYQPYRVKISEDGRIFVSSLDLNGVVVWEVSKDLQTWTPVISGTNDATDYNIYDAGGNFVAGINCSMDVIGSGENLKLLLYSTNNKGIVNNQGGYRLDEYALGTATTWTGTPKNIINGGKYGVVHTNVEFIYDGEGGYWFGGSRAGNAGQPNLVHINAEGVEDYRNEDASLYGGDGVLLHNGMLFKGKARTSSTVGNFGVWTVGKDADGKVTLTEKWSVVANGIGRNLNEFAVDYAENLYIVGNSGEKIIAYALPYSGEVETPAAAKYAFQLEATVVEPVELVGVVKRALQIGESTVVLTHEADGTPHIYNIIDEEIAEVSQEGVIARDPENPGDFLSISDIALTEDGKLVACNYTRCNYNDGTVEAGYKRGTTYVYKWEDLTAAPSIWFTSQYASNSNKSDQGYTMALNGSSTNCQILMSGVHRYGNGVRFTIFDVVDDEVSESFFGYQLGSGLGEGELAIFDEAYDGTNFQLSVSPRNEKKDYIMDAEKMAPVEFKTAGANEEPIVLGELDASLVGVKFNGVTYLTVGAQAIMVAPYADADGQLVGVKVLDITAGLDKATELKVADLAAPVAATAAATAVAVADNVLTITLVADAALHVLEVELEKGPATALENISVEGKAIKMIKNGQLIIIKNGVQYNVQGQVIK